MPNYQSYIICGSPRLGSTLLCEMLAASGVAGRPNSFFRRESIADWADRWLITRSTGMESVDFDRAYLAAMLVHGRAETDIFGLRLMWPSVAELSTRLGRAIGQAADIPAQIHAAFGPTLYVHLSRDDKLAQAISLVRAEQSGLWHLSADGSILEGTSTPAQNSYDGERLKAVVSELKSDDDQWRQFFQSHAIVPLRLKYEAVTANPQAALAELLENLGRDPQIAKRIPTKTAKMADGTSAAWAARFLAENGA